MQDVHRADLRREGATFVVREEQQRLRNDKLAELGALEVFHAGAALVTGADGRPDPRPVVGVVTADEIVLLDADVQGAPEGEVGRIPRREITGIRLLDEHGEAVDPTEVDEVAEMNAPRDRRYVVWVDRKSGDRFGAHAFVFRALSVAAEAQRDLERAIPA